MPSKSLTSWLLVTTWYLKENLLISSLLVGISSLDEEMSARALNVSLSNVLPRIKVGEV